MLIDNPKLKPKSSVPTVPRHSLPIAHASLTHIVIPKIPLAAGSGALLKQWQAAKVDEEWASSSWAQTRARGDKRRALSDFDRFKVMKLRKQVSASEAVATAKASS